MNIEGVSVAVSDDDRIIRYESHFRSHLRDVIFIIVTVMGVFANVSASESYLRLGCTTPKGSAMQVEVERLYRAAFHNVGVQLIFIPMPNLREQAALISGEIDGVCGRIKQFAQLSKQTSLKRIPVSITYSEVSAFSLEPLTSLMDKRESSVLSYSLGELSIRRILPVLRHHDLKPAPTADKGAQWLRDGKTKIFVGDDIHFETAWRRADLKQQLYRKVIYTDDYYMFLTSKYSTEFVRRLSNSLQQQLALNGGPLNFREILAGRKVLVEYTHDPVVAK